MALDNFRRIDMKINRANDYQIETQFAKEGDYNGRELVVQITDAGDVKNQSGVSLNLGWRHDSVGNTGLDPFTVVDITKGIFKIAYPKEMLNAGLVTAVIQVVENDKITLTRNFKITVENNPIDEDAIVSENSFTALTEALVKVNDLEDNYAPRLNEVTAQLAQTTDENTFNITGYGAVGDGVTDDTQAIQNVFNNVKAGDTVLIPNGSFLTKDTITVTKPVRVIMNGYILADHEKTGLIFKDNSSQGSFHPNYHNGEKIGGNIRVKRVQKKDYEKKPTAIGVEIWNVFSGVLHLEDLEGHYIGILLRADKYGTGYAGTSYCMFTIGVLNSYKDNMLFKTSNGGWITQNQFYSGSMTGSSGEDLETIHVNIDGGTVGQISENTFYSVSFEGGKKKAVKGRRSQSNRFIACRYEMPNITHVFDLENSHSYEFQSGTFLSNHMIDGLFNDNTESRGSTWTNTSVKFNDYQIGAVEYIDRIFYIKPKKNQFGRGDQIVNNVVHPATQDRWSDVRFSTNGKQTFRIFSNSSNTQDGNHTLELKNGSEFMIYDGEGYRFDNITLSNPPNYSTEIVLYKSVSANKEINLLVDNTIDSFIDRTDVGLKIPYGFNYARLYYNYTANRLYLLETF